MPYLYSPSLKVIPIKFSHLLFQLFLAVMAACMAYNSAAQTTTLVGNIGERNTDTPLPFANVVLLRTTDSAKIMGATTDINGGFEMQAPNGNYYLWVSFIGFQNHYESVVLSGGKLRIKTIKLQADATQLQEIQVEAAGKLFSTDFDKKIFNVENVTIADGGSAIDLLETLPSIQVSDEGSLSLRGSGDILIFINGRQTSLSAGDAESILQQFPASAIESVELITNPSSKYDAAGVGGIINIVLKKGQMKGLNGQVNSSVGTNHKYQAGVNLNYRTEKVNYFFQYGYQYRESWQEGRTYRAQFGGEAQPIFRQTFNTLNFNQAHNTRFGFDWDVTERHLLGVFVNGNLSPEERTRNYISTFEDAEGNFNRRLLRDLSETELGRNGEVGVNWQFNIRKGESLQTLASFSIDDVARTEFFNQRDVDINGVLLPENLLYQEFLRPRYTAQTILQADYEKKLSNNARIDFGAKATLRRFVRDQQLLEGDAAGAPLLANPLATDTFQFVEDVWAGYLNYRNKWGKIGVQAGLRAEATFTQGTPTSWDSTIINNYLNWFPSLYLDYKIKENSSILANYSKRISRPWVGALAPLLNVQDPLNVRLGSPFLQPSLTDNFELGYSGKIRKVFATITLFHRYTTNGVVRIFEPFEALGPAAVAITWANASTQNNTGLEWINQFGWGNQLDATFTANAFYAQVAVPQDGAVLRNTNFSWTLTLLANWRIPRVMNVQVTGNYRGPMVMPQGEIAPIFNMGFGLRREIMQGKGTLSLNLSDAFNTQRFLFTSTTPIFYQERFFNRETRILTFGFTYRFKGFRNKQASQLLEERGGGDPFD
jgi:iron complex outermembrane recepter protein